MYVKDDHFAAGGGRLLSMRCATARRRRRLYGGVIFVMSCLEIFNTVDNLNIQCKHRQHLNTSSLQKSTYKSGCISPQTYITSPCHTQCHRIYTSTSEMVSRTSGVSSPVPPWRRPFHSRIDRHEMMGAMASQKCSPATAPAALYTLSE